MDCITLPKLRVERRMLALLDDTQMRAFIGYNRPPILDRRAPTPPIMAPGGQRVPDRSTRVRARQPNGTRVLKPVATWTPQDRVPGRTQRRAAICSKRHESVPPIDDAVEATGWWGCFAKEGVAAGPQPFRTRQKIGRNEPCPCGSGKKYKKRFGA